MPDHHVAIKVTLVDNMSPLSQIISYCHIFKAQASTEWFPFNFDNYDYLPLSNCGNENCSHRYSQITSYQRSYIQSTSQHSQTPHQVPLNSFSLLYYKQLFYDAFLCAYINCFLSQGNWCSQFMGSCMECVCVCECSQLHGFIFSIFRGSFIAGLLFSLGFGGHLLPCDS